MKKMFARLCVSVVLLSPCFADFATPFVEIKNKPGDIADTRARVVALGPNIGSQFLVIVMNDQEQPVVLWATAKKGILDDSVLGREVQIKAKVTRAGTATSPPEIEILRTDLLKSKLVEQDGAGQPATAPESKPESNPKPQPESEGRSQ